MPSPAARRSPRAAPVARAAEPAGRPDLVPYAAVFALLTAGVVLYLGWLLWQGDPEAGPLLTLPVVLALAVAAGAGMVWRGVRGGWVVLAVASLVPLLAIVSVAFLFGALGAAGDMWLALLLAVAPVNGLVLACRAPVRAWCAHSRGTRPAGGTRAGRRAR
ncbi:hypothetical protein [Blastococcus atacamensis]|uniref:hypothetical protein n=1 Tax=Blastococcus atacamensis TaxID=2070508 RepID=UPI000CEC01F8|nr:hypothetical protein [Blastococcus atacamensis]